VRPDQQAIVRWVPRGARVLDLGCGDGTLLRSLWQEREAPGYGVEIEDAAALECVANDDCPKKCPLSGWPLRE